MNEVAIIVSDETGPIGCFTNKHSMEAALRDQCMAVTDLTEKAAQEAGVELPLFADREYEVIVSKRLKTRFVPVEQARIVND